MFKIQIFTTTRTSLVFLIKIKFPEKYFQVNFDRLDEFNQKVLKIKMANPETAQQILEEAKTSKKF